MNFVKGKLTKLSSNFTIVEGKSKSVSILKCLWTNDSQHLSAISWVKKSEGVLRVMRGPTRHRPDVLILNIAFRFPCSSLQC